MVGRMSLDGFDRLEKTCHLTRRYKGLSRRLILMPTYRCSVHAEVVLAFTLSYNGPVRNLTRRAIETHDLSLAIDCSDEPIGGGGAAVNASGHTELESSTVLRVWCQYQVGSPLFRLLLPCKLVSGGLEDTVDSRKKHGPRETVSFGRRHRPRSPPVTSGTRVL